jgi:putative tryptophan/tyrosine transport system permease protein
MTLLLSAWTIGLILSLLALGTYISFRIFAFPDITVDGSLTLGAAVAAILIVKGQNPVWATVAGSIAGALAGTTTGVLHTRFGINKLLAGILTMTALYSINLHVMGKSNLPLLSSRTLVTLGERAGLRLLKAGPIRLLGWDIGLRDATSLFFAFVSAGIVGLGLYWFFRTNIGSAMRATGDNAQMIRALGVSVENMTVLGLALSNGLVALAGAMLAQYQGFADVQMGIGMVVWGLASVIIGEALIGSISLGFTVVGAVAGSVLFRLMVAIALRWGLDPNDLKLITAGFVFFALVMPSLARQLNTRRLKVRHARAA